MDRFRTTATIAAGATFLLVTIGGLVRSTDSGLGCSTDWPGCNGRLIPDLSKAEVAIEFSHRVTAGIVAVLIGLLAYQAVRHHRDRPGILWGSVGAVGLVLFQAWLGRAVVVEELEAAIVVVHMTTAMLLFALVGYLALNAAEADGAGAVAKDPSTARRAIVAAVSVLGLMIVGSYLSGYGDAAVVRGWPVMEGGVVPDLTHEPTAVHFLHRILAVVVGGIVAYVSFGIIRRKDVVPLQAKLAHAAVGLFAIEVLIGAANIWTTLSPAAVTAHLAVGSLIWMSFVAIAVVSLPRAVAARAVASEPALGEGR